MWLERLPRRFVPRNDANPPEPAVHPPLTRGTLSLASLAKAMSKTYNSKKIHFNDFSLY